MRAGRWSLAAVGLVAAASLGACGGSGPDSSAPSDATAAPSQDTSASETPASPEAVGYLPVPDGVTLTDPGTELAYADAAVAAWTPRQDLVGVVDVAVDRVVVTTVKKSLAGFRLSKEDRAATPYFVRTSVTNVGGTDLGARQLPLYVVDSQGRLVAPTGVAPDFEACPHSTLPAVFAPGDRTPSCLIFLVPDGGELQSVMFRPPEGVVPLVWTGEVTERGIRATSGATGKGVVGTGTKGAGAKGTAPDPGPASPAS